MNRTAYDSVKTARGSDRPTGLDYIKEIFTEFFELHGDRRFADDPAVVGGIARLSGRPVTVIAIEKGHTAKERAARYFGAPGLFPGADPQAGLVPPVAVVLLPRPGDAGAHFLPAPADGGAV